MRRVPELDAVRGIASLAIVLFHLRFMRTFPVLGSAIDLFFVLSGYLITTILLDGEASPRSLARFYLRRAFRIWPIYYLTLAAFLVVNAARGRPDPTEGLPYFLTYFQFIQGYGSGPLPPFSRHFDHTWTLAIEEQFYLIWPLLVCLAGRRSLIRVVPLLIVGSVALRATGVPRILLLGRIDGLALGGLLAALLHDRGRLERHRATFQRAFVAVGLLAASAPVWGRLLFSGVPLFSIARRLWPQLEWAPTCFSFTLFKIALVCVCFVGWLVCTAGHPFLAPLRGHRLCELGRISYGLYLYHPFVFILSFELHHGLGLRGSPWIDTLKVVLSIGVAALSWRFVERPLLSLRDRLTAGTVVPWDKIRFDAPEPLLRGPHRVIRDGSRWEALPARR